MDHLCELLVSQGFSGDRVLDPSARCDIHAVREEIIAVALLLNQQPVAFHLVIRQAPVLDHGLQAVVCDFHGQNSLRDRLRHFNGIGSVIIRHIGFPGLMSMV